MEKSNATGPAEAGTSAETRASAEAGASPKTGAPAETGEATSAPASSSGWLNEPWWKTWPEVYEAETRSLKDFEHSQNPRLFRKGILQVTVNYPDGDQFIKLVVTYPDLYPFFRFEVQAPDKQYLRHQNPLLKNLCLLERRTDAWEIGDTLGGILEAQMPKLLATATGGQIAETSDQDDQQAEPVSAYYNYTPGSILVDSAWQLPPGISSGWLDLAIAQSPVVFHDGLLSFPAAQAAVLTVRDEQKQPILVAEQTWSKAYREKTISARWLRLSESPIIDDPDAFMKTLFSNDKKSHLNESLHWQSGIRIRTWAILFPEQHSFGGVDGLGWMFVQHLEGDQSSKPQTSKTLILPRNSNSNQGPQRRGRWK